METLNPNLIKDTIRPPAVRFNGLDLNTKTPSDIRVFHKLSAIQEYQHCQLGFSSAIKSQPTQKSI